MARVKNDFETAKRREDMLNHSYRAQQRRGYPGSCQDSRLQHSQEGSQIYQRIDIRSDASASKELWNRFRHAAKQHPGRRPAQKPLFPSKPNVPMTTLFGMLGSLSLALVWVAIRQNGEVMVEYPGQTRQALNIPELGVIPAARSLRCWPGRCACARCRKMSK